MPGQKREARLRARCPGHPRLCCNEKKKGVDGRVKPGHDELWRWRVTRLPRRASAGTNAADGRETQKTAETKSALAARAGRPRSRRDRGDPGDGGENPRGL